MQRTLVAIVTLASMTLALVAYGEVYIEKSVTAGPADEPGRTDIVTPREIIVNGIPTHGRSWVTAEEFKHFAARVSSSVRQSKPLAPVVRVDGSSLSIVEFMPSGAVRVLSARPAGLEGRTTVWEAQLSLTDFLHQLDETAQGIAPGRDHPVLGAPAAARRVNVVETLGRDYSFAAVYLSSLSPRALLTERTARLKALGATLDAEEYSQNDAHVALSFAGRRIDLFAAYDAAHATTEFVMQTDLPPETPRERS